MKNQQEIQHFSHHHALIPLMLEEGEELNCNGCDAQIQEPFHGCISCNYFLHDTCLSTPRFLQHPSHPPHPLTLLPTPTYPSRSFACNACGYDGKSFSFSCAQCECDLHLQCAALPKTLRIRNKHDHVLKLIFGSPHEEKAKAKAAIFACEICRKNIHPNLWLYYCAGCDYGVHLVCTTLIKTSCRVKNDVKTGGGKEKEKQKQKTTNVENQRAVLLKETEDLQNSVYELQRKMKMQHIGNKMVLEALDNASDYVGSSHRY